jgi:2-(1,2-epoxy-1,2-dihydrophenyl)acetyl-CoA isomerase
VHGAAEHLRAEGWHRHADGHLSFDEVAAALAQGVDKLLADPARAVEVLGAVANDGVLRRLEAARSLGEIALDTRTIEHPQFPEATIRTPLIVKLKKSDRATYLNEWFGPIAFVVATDGTADSLAIARDAVVGHGALTMAVYSTRDEVIDRAIEGCRRRGCRAVDQPDGQHLRQPVRRVFRFSRHRRQSGSKRRADRRCVRRQSLPRRAASRARLADRCAQGSAADSRSRSMNYEQIRFETGDRVARITLNRPDRLNSFTAQMHAELRDALARVTGDGDARVLVLTGAGRAFCAGQDLSDRAVAPGAAPVDLGASIEDNYRPAGALHSQPAAAGGVRGQRRRRRRRREHRARVRHRHRDEIGELHPGVLQDRLVPDSGGTYFLPRLVGSARAMGLAFFGDRVSAEQAAEWGLIWKCVDDGEFVATTDAMAAQLADAPTAGLAAIKRALYASSGNTLEQQLDVERDAQRALGNSADYREGVAAFLEKRAPRFSGR